MADTKIENLNPMTIPEAPDVLPIVDDPSGSPETQKITFEDLQTAILSKHRHVATVIVASDGSGDFIDIQDGIDALPAGGGLVFIKDGIYTLTTTITIAKSNVEVMGQGDATLITLDNTANVNVFTLGNGADSFSNIILRDFKIDGNEAQQASNGRGINILGLVLRIIIDNVHIIETKGYSVSSDQDTDYLTIKNCLFDNDAGVILIDYANHLYLLNNIHRTTKKWGIGIYNSTYVFVKNCFFECTGDESHYYSSAYFNGCNHVLFESNIIRNHENHNVQFQNCNYVSCIGNHSDGCANEGIYFNTGTKIICEGNVLYNNSIGIGAYSILGFLITGNTIFSSLTNGIFLFDCAHGIVSVNNIHDSSQTTNNISDQIRLYNNSTYNLVSGNSIYAVAANKAKYGINENSVGCNYNLIQGNIIIGSVTLAVRVQGANTLVDTNLI